MRSVRGLHCTPKSEPKISAFGIRLLESIIPKLALSKFSIFLLVSAAQETGLSLALSETLLSRGPCYHKQLVKIVHELNFQMLTEIMEK